MHNILTLVQATAAENQSKPLLPEFCTLSKGDWITSIGRIRRKHTSKPKLSQGATWTQTSMWLGPGQQDAVTRESPQPVPSESMDQHGQQNTSVRCITPLWEPSRQEGFCRDPTAMLSRRGKRCCRLCVALDLSSGCFRSQRLECWLGNRSG